MKKIFIKQLHLTNFKGLRDLTVDFSDDQVTSILGRNGSGKTTIFDSFTYLFFGKDSEDRKNFNIKTLDERGQVISKIPHEVSAIIEVNGEVITLCRRYVEKWTKKRGSATEEFTGHEEERLYNDVPCSLKEWNEKIANICPENVFKFITNPMYFSAQKSDVQREMLFRMAGEISDQEIAAGNADFEALLSHLTGKTMEEYKKEIQAKKRRIKAEIETIPDRIDERKRDMPEDREWSKLEEALSIKKDELSKVEDLILDKSKAYNEAQTAKMEISQEISSLKQKRMTLEFEIKSKVQAGYNEKIAKQREMKQNVSLAESEKSRVLSEQSRYEADLVSLNKKRDGFIAQWREINARQLSFDENAFVCPTCHRPLEIEDIEKKQEEMTNSFNAQKAEALAKNNAEGKANTQVLRDTEKLIETCKGRIAEIDQKNETIKADPLFAETLTAPDATPEIVKDPQYIALSDEITKKETEYNTPIEISQDDQDLKAQRSTLSGEIDTIKRDLSTRDIIAKNNARIAELEEQYKNQSQELADLESIEFTIQAFSKARVEAIESRINGLFSFVRFKMFDQQINGGEVETCEAMVNGVPYSDLNNAMKINSGLDIINAICSFDQIYAPIFVDNAEAVNDLIPTKSQMIRLVVTENETLTIINNK